MKRKEDVYWRPKKRPVETNFKENTLYRRRNNIEIEWSNHAIVEHDYGNRYVDAVAAVQGCGVCAEFMAQLYQSEQWH